VAAEIFGQATEQTAAEMRRIKCGRVGRLGKRKDKTMSNFDYHYQKSLEYDAKAAKAREEALRAWRNGNNWLAGQLDQAAQYFDRRSVKEYGMASGIPPQMC
jgi:hypothetical protein